MNPLLVHGLCFVGLLLAFLFPAGLVVLIPVGFLTAITLTIKRRTEIVVLEPRTVFFSYVRQTNWLTGGLLLLGSFLNNPHFIYAVPPVIPATATVALCGFSIWAILWCPFSFWILFRTPMKLAWLPLAYLVIGLLIPVLAFIAGAYRWWFTAVWWLMAVTFAIGLYTTSKLPKEPRVLGCGKLHIAEI